MNTKLRQIGFFAILPPLTARLSPDYIIDGDALKSQGDVAPRHIGIRSDGSATANGVC